MSNRNTKSKKGSGRPKSFKSGKLKAQIASDLHLEFPNVLSEVENLVPVVADILILPGDIGNISSPSYVPFFKWASRSFRHVIYVPGNHEFYHQEYFSALEKMKEIFSSLPNVHFLYRTGVRIEGVRFLGVTLWTCPPNNKKEYIQTIYNDYRYIGVQEKGKKRARYLTIHDTVRFHKEDIAWLTREIGRSREAKEEVYVISHHLPLMGLKFLIPKERTRGVSDVIYGNCTDESVFILKSLDTLKAWFHGHTHYSMITTYSEEDKFGKKIIRKRRKKKRQQLIEEKKKKIIESRRLKTLKKKKKKLLKMKKKNLKKQTSSSTTSSSSTSTEESEEGEKTPTSENDDDNNNNEENEGEESEEESEEEEIGEVTVELEDIQRLWVISNQVGYTSGRETSGYKRNLLVDIPLPKAPEFIHKPIEVKKNNNKKSKSNKGGGVVRKELSQPGSTKWASLRNLRRSQSNLEMTRNNNNNPNNPNNNSIKERVSGLLSSWRNFIFGDNI